MGVSLYLKKLKYLPVKAWVSRPIRRRGAAKIKKAGIQFNKMDYVNGIHEDEITRRFAKAVEVEIADRKAQGHPIAVYKEGKAYLEYPDGRKVYV